MTPPVVILGVSRSGTTMLRVILDRSPSLAIPDESFFVPLLARRHRGSVDLRKFLDDVGRIPTISAWGLTADDVAFRLQPGATVDEAIAAIFEAYAAKEGKPRWGDKTPMYMRHLPLLERIFPDAQFVHLVRDGRDAALSFLELPKGTYTRTWAHPRSIRQFACLWRTEVSAARSLGARVGPMRYLEVRYEDLVAEPGAAVRRICDFGGLAFDPGMVEYTSSVDVSAKPHQQRLLQPPTPGVREWRFELRENEVASFEGVAGDLLADLGYDVVQPPHPPRGTARLALARYRVLLGLWNIATTVVQRSPLWRRRHPPLEGQAGGAFLPR